MSLSIVFVVSDGDDLKAVRGQFAPDDSPEQALVVALSKAGVVGFAGWEMTDPTGDVITGRGIATLAAVPVLNDSTLRVRRRAAAAASPHAAASPAAAAAAPPPYSAAMAGHPMKDLDGAVEGMAAHGGDDEGEGVAAPAAGISATPYDVEIRDTNGDGRYISVRMRATDTVALLKRRYCAARAIPADCFLLCDTTALDDDRARLCDVGLMPDEGGRVPGVDVVRRYVPDAKSKFPVHVRTLAGRECTIEVDSAATVTDFKVLIALATGPKLDDQRLIYGGKQLDDWPVRRTLGDYKLTAKATVHIVLKLRGD